MEFQRLKDKLGTRSLPSSEVEFRGIEGRLVGEEGRGVPAIIRMVNHTRLDCLLGSTTGCAAARWRRSTTLATAALRGPAGRSAGDAQRAGRPGDRVRGGDGHRDAGRPQLRRRRRGRLPPLRHGGDEVLGVQAGRRHAAEALECLGGNGFVEESGMPLIYRDAPLNSIWEGSGNVAALDVLRAIVREPEGLRPSWLNASSAAGADPRLDDHLARTRERVRLFAGADADSAEQRLYNSQFEARRRGRGAGRRAPGLAARPPCAAGGGRRVLRRPPGRARAGSTGRSRPASTPRRSSIAHCPA